MQRIFYYLLYYFFAKSLPQSYKLGLIGKWSSGCDGSFAGLCSGIPKDFSARIASKTI